jgi:hypothetical protein
MMLYDYMRNCGNFKITHFLLRTRYKFRSIWITIIEGRHYCFAPRRGDGSVREPILICFATYLLGLLVLSSWEFFLAIYAKCSARCAGTNLEEGGMNAIPGSLIVAAELSGS